jgi:hypothetical protein
MNDIHVYSIQTYEKHILHDYYCQIVTHQVCDDVNISNHNILIKKYVFIKDITNVEKYLEFKHHM